MILSHKPSECIGCDLCCETAPEYFEMGDDGMARLIDIQKEHGVFTYTEALRVDEDELREAEEGCPVNIIHVDP